MAHATCWCYAARNFSQRRFWRLECLSLSLRPQGLVSFSTLHRGPLFQSHVPEPCQAQKNPGPVTPTLHRSCTCCTIWTREISLEILSAQYYTVGQHICESTCTHLFCWMYHSRDCHCFILPMHCWCIVRPAQSHKEQRHQVGTCGPHYGHFLALDSCHCNGP